MANIPPKPARKSPTQGTDNLARPTSGGVSKSAYVRKTATGPVSLNRRPAGVTPSGQPINDKDAGKGTGNVRG